MGFTSWIKTENADIIWRLQRKSYFLCDQTGFGPFIRTSIMVVLMRGQKICLLENEQTFYKTNGIVKVF